MQGEPDRDEPSLRHGEPFDPPNILLLMTDQQRWDAMGCVSDWIPTPNIDRIAAEGVRFPNAYTNCPMCVPARASLLTGRYPHELGVWKHARYTVPTDPPTWVQRIRKFGHCTSVFGKIHLHPHEGDLRDRVPLMNDYGFDHVDEIAGPRASVKCRSNLTDLWEQAGVMDAYRTDLQDRLATTPWVARPSPLPFDLYPDVYVGRQAVEYLKNYSSDQPWLCWVSFSGPHEPWDAPEPYASLVDPAATPPPVAFSKYKRLRPRGVLDRRLANRRDIDAVDIAKLRANYAGNVSLIDDQIGQLLDVVRTRGELDNTVIVMISDHGEMNGDFGILYKGVFLNAAVRIPVSCACRPPPSQRVARYPTRSSSSWTSGRPWSSWRTAPRSRRRPTHVASPGSCIDQRPSTGTQHYPPTTTS